MNTVNRPPDMASIKFMRGPLAGRTFSINKPITTIGTDSSNDIVIKDDPNVAQYHARLQEKKGRWSIEKHPQASTVTVNSQSIQQAAIQNNATIGLGENTSFIFLLHAETMNPVGADTQIRTSQTTPPAEYSTQPISPSSALPSSSPAIRSPLPTSMHDPTGPIAEGERTFIAPLSALGIPSLEVSSNTFGEKKSYALDKLVINIGRNASNDIVINDQIISSFHIQIVREGNQLILVHPHPERRQTLCVTWSCLKTM